jgi:hypothetical protein
VALEPVSTLEISREVCRACVEEHADTRGLLQTAMSPWCPVCGEKHDVWECQVLVPVDVDSDDESSGRRLDELSAASREMYEKSVQKTQTEARGAAQAATTGPTASVPERSKDSDAVLVQVVESLQRLTLQVRSLDDGLGSRLTAVEKGLGDVSGRLVAIEQQTGGRLLGSFGSPSSSFKI